MWCVLSCSVMSKSSQLRGLQPVRLLCPWDFPDKNTGVGCHFLLQGIFLTQRSNLHLLHWQADFLPLHHLGSPNAINGNVNWYSHYVEQYEDSLKKKILKIELPYHPTILLLQHISGENHNLKRRMYFDGHKLVNGHKPVTGHQTQENIAQL